MNNMESMMNRTSKQRIGNTPPLPHPHLNQQLNMSPSHQQSFMTANRQQIPYQTSGGSGQPPPHSQQQLRPHHHMQHPSPTHHQNSAHHMSHTNDPASSFSPKSHSHMNMMQQQQTAVPCVSPVGGGGVANIYRGHPSPRSNTSGYSSPAAQHPQQRAQQGSHHQGGGGLINNSMMAPPPGGRGGSLAPSPQSFSPHRTPPSNSSAGGTFGPMDQGVPPNFNHPSPSGHMMNYPAPRQPPQEMVAPNAGPHHTSSRGEDVMMQGNVCLPSSRNELTSTSSSSVHCSVSLPFYLMQLENGDSGGKGDGDKMKVITGATNMIAYKGLQHSYSKLSSKKSKDHLSSFLSHVPGNVDITDTSGHSSLKVLIEKPPIGGKELMSLTPVQMSGFRLHPGPLPQNYIKQAHSVSPHVIHAAHKKNKRMMMKQQEQVKKSGKAVQHKQVHSTARKQLQEALHVDRSSSLAFPHSTNDVQMMSQPHTVTEDRKRKHGSSSSSTSSKSRQTAAPVDHSSAAVPQQPPTVVVLDDGPPGGSSVIHEDGSDRKRRKKEKKRKKNKESSSDRLNGSSSSSKID